MIMKDEEDELPIVIASAAGLADEIVIYDTGSTDRSVALARELGATVIEGYWDDDFSRARNEALEHCVGEWILWLDADESINGDKAAFRTRLARDRTFDAYAVSIESLEGGGLGGRMAFPAARVFRRERCHWHGPLHEQISWREGDRFPPTSNCSELRILHRGYTSFKWHSKELIERNLRIAEQALEDPEVDHSRALYDYGRTLAGSEDAHVALAPLREAADTTSYPMVRRAALRTMFDIHLGLEEFAEASAVVEQLRRGLKKTISADVMDIRLALAKKDYETCLEAIDRLPYADSDEDGFELGRACLAWAKAQALEGLCRPGEAADALLDALRTHGQLDVGLQALVALLTKAGRSVTELVRQARPESMPVLAATASRLKTPEADLLLACFAEAYPDRLEPLAAAREVAARLGVPRAMWWSDRFRRAGLIEMCPLLAIARDETLEPLFRLLAAAGGYLSFKDQRLVPPARLALSAIDAGERRGAIENVHAVSPELAKLIVSSTQAVQLSRSGVGLDGYLTYSTRSHAGGAPVDPGALPLDDATVHDLVGEDVLCAVPHGRAPAVLREWARVICEGGRLRLSVPNLAALPGLIASGSPAELRRVVYGGRRFGDDGLGEANADAWSTSELEACLEDVGFIVEQIDASTSISVSARRAPVVSRRASTAPLAVCVVVTASCGSEELLVQLRALSGTECGVDFETVVFVNGPDDSSWALCSGLEGDVTTARSTICLGAAAAVDEAARLARAQTIVVLSSRARPLDGWLARLVAPLADPTVAVSGAAVVDERGLVVHAGFDLVGDAVTPSLECVARSGYLRAEVALVADCEVDAVGAEAFALRRELWDELRGLHPGWSEADAVIDLCLRARTRGLRCVVPAGCVIKADAPAKDPESRERLAWHWAGRTSLRQARLARVSASSLMPSSTLIERVSSVMAVPAKPRQGGLNLVGDFAETRVRSYAAALAGSGTPLSRLDWAGGVPVPVGDDEPFAYATTLLALDGDQLVDYVGEVGIDSLRDRRTIIAWEWPLADAPSGAAAQAAMVGEVWVPSSFVNTALHRVAPRPVLVVPPAVVVPSNVSRAEAGIPDGFVFVAVGRLGRCRPGEVALVNPLGAIEAFKMAFAPGCGPLLSVVLQGRKTAATAEACRLAAQERPDVTVSETDDPALADAASVTGDCLVSLHRASAFGPDLARALAVGCPVVSTAYGGPMDFLSEQCAGLVPYTIVKSAAATYPFPAGTSWAEPDLDAAVSCLRSVYEDLSEARRKAWLGRPGVIRRSGPKAAARALRRQLGEPPFVVPQARDRHRIGAAR
jgi:GT2 family glycosyltransferase/glycosyltransferase involved in cell wall biosynthesis